MQESNSEDFMNLILNFILIICYTHEITYEWV